MHNFRWIALAALLGIGCRNAWIEADQGPIGGTGPNAKSGFVTEEKEGRLWIFRWGSKELSDFRKKGELAKFVTKIGAGPGGATVHAPDLQTIYDYLYGKPGFTTWIDKEGRLWVFRKYAPELSEFAKSGDLGKHVSRLGAGPGGKTIKAPNAETIDAYRKA